MRQHLNKLEIHRFSYRYTDIHTNKQTLSVLLQPYVESTMVRIVTRIIRIVTRVVIIITRITRIVTRLFRKWNYPNRKWNYFSNF